MSSPDPHDEQMEALFAEAGRREQPPEAMKRQWEAVFRRELESVITAKRQRRRSFYGATAAVMALAVGAFLLVGQPSQPPVVVANVVSAVDGNYAYSDGQPIEPLTIGSRVHVGLTVRTAAEGMLALNYRDADVRLNRDTTVRFHTAQIELIHGSVYVDTGDARQQGALPVVVTTALGSFRHVGTQFMVAVDEDQDVTAAVREGTILLRTADEVQKQFTATEEGAELVEISSAGNLAIHRTDSHGELWSWVVSSSPGKVIDGMTAHDILHWIARETGLKLRYADPDGSGIAGETQRAMDEPVGPQQALEWIRRTTDLMVDDTSGVELIVSRKPEAT